jgi:hypothetical protein
MSTEVIVVPTVNDVVMGRGKRIDVHPGNVSFRRLVWTQRAAYISAGRATQLKRSIAEWVVNQVIDSGGRFVKAGLGKKYQVVSLHDAVEKTTQALREKHMREPPNCEEPTTKKLPTKALASKKIAKASSYKTVSLKAPVSKGAKASKGSIKSQGAPSKKTRIKASPTTVTTTSLDDMLLSFDPRSSDDDLFGEWLMDNGAPNSNTGHRVTLQRTATTYSAIQTRTGATTTRQASKAGHRNTIGISTTTTASMGPFVHSDIMDKDAAGSNVGVPPGVNGINSNHHCAVASPQGGNDVPGNENFNATVDNGPPLLCPQLAEAAPVAALTSDPNRASFGTKNHVLAPSAPVMLASSLASMMMNPLLRNGDTNSTASGTMLSTTSLMSLAATMAEHGANHGSNSSDTAVAAFERVDDHGASGDAYRGFRHCNDGGLGGNPPAAVETMGCSDPSTRALWDPNLAYLWFHPLDSSSSHPLLHDESDSDDSDSFDPLKVWHTLLPTPPDHAGPTLNPLSRD